MAKIFGILLVVVGIWLGLEVYQNGMQGAFGGVLATSDEKAAGDPRSVPQRAGAAVERAHTEAEARLERMLAD